MFLPTERHIGGKNLFFLNMFKAHLSQKDKDYSSKKFL